MEGAPARSAASRQVIGPPMVWRMAETEARPSAAWRMAAILSERWRAAAGSASCRWRASRERRTRHMRVARTSAVEVEMSRHSESAHSRRSGRDAVSAVAPTAASLSTLRAGHSRRRRYASWRDRVVTSVTIRPLAGRGSGAGRRVAVGGEAAEGRLAPGCGLPASRRVLLQLLQIPGPLGVAQEGGPERVPGQLEELGVVDAEVALDEPVVVVDVAAEVGGVVGVDGDEQARIDHLGEGVIRHATDRPQAHVGERADGQRDPLGAQARHQGRVLQATVPVIDAGDPQQVERLPDVTGRPLLAGVGDTAEALAAGAIKQLDKLRRRMAHLAMARRHKSREHFLKAEALI